MVERARERLVSADDLMLYEDGNMSHASTLDLFQRLVDSGMAWTLQGSYGREAQRLLDSGAILPAGRA